MTHKNVWFVTGGATARVFRSQDAGESWSVAETPIMHGPPSAGIFSVAFRDGKHGASRQDLVVTCLNNLGQVYRYITKPWDAKEVKGIFTPEEVFVEGKRLYHARATGTGGG